MRVALAQINPTVGDLSGNAEKMASYIDEARGRGAELVVFPELCLWGYPPKDLLLKRGLLGRSREALERLAGRCRGVTCLIGFADENPGERGKPLRNAAGCCRDGRLQSVHHKVLLPTYDVFDECRYFEPGGRPHLAAVPTASGTVPVGVTICEDLWAAADIGPRVLYTADPVGDIVAQGARVLVNLSASPFRVGLYRRHSDLAGQLAARHRVAIVIVNQVGGNDDLVFDGASSVYDATGRCVARAAAFAEDLLIVDLEHPEPADLRAYPEDVESLYAALVLGTRDYVSKCGFSGTVIGLSGGIDSSVAAAIVCEAVGAENVCGVAMPSRYSSRESLEDAQALARNLGIRLETVPIEPIHEAFRGQLAGAFGEPVEGVTDENLQARIRGALLMAFSNRYGWLVISTGNKSELAVGYCTLYGDMAGGLAVISDVPKTRVYALAEYINRRAGREVIPRRVLTKPPSAELRPNQTDQDTLPPYDLLDEILRLYVEEEMTVDEVCRVLSGRGDYSEAVVRDVVRRVDRNEYKRKQAALGIKVTSRAFGTGRRMPIAARY